jgi:reactive intermediate/imine deaminase
MSAAHKLSEAGYDKGSRISAEGGDPPSADLDGHESGNLVFVAGIVALDASGNIVGKGDIKAQTRQVLENIKELVAAAGGTLSDVTKTTVYLTDFGNYASMNEVYREYFANSPPARATVKVELFNPSFLVEIDAIAVVP